MTRNLLCNMSTWPMRTGQKKHSYIDPLATCKLMNNQKCFQETVSQCDTLVGHSCGALLGETLVEHSCRTLLRDTLVGGLPYLLGGRSHVPSGALAHLPWCHTLPSRNELAPRHLCIAHRATFIPQVPHSRPTEWLTCELQLGAPGGQVSSVGTTDSCGTLF